jgi:hypothetical protein
MPDSGPPPPLRLKVERQGGSGITFIAIDPGTLIRTVEEMRPRFRTPPPPPPLKGRKAGGVRNPICTVDPGARISAAQKVLVAYHGRISIQNLGQVGF